MAKLFISHSSHDKQALAQPLFHALTARGHEVWYDQASVGMGGSIPLEISDGLASAEVFLIVVSPTYNASDWCRMELGAIIANCIGTSKRMFVLRVDDAALKPLISHLRYFPVLSRDLSDGLKRDAILLSVAEFVERIQYEPAERAADKGPATTEALVEAILEAERTRRFGQDVLPREPDADREGRELAGLAEGLLLIKPRGTFFKPCLVELLRRIQVRCEVCQIRVFDGATIRRRNLFRQQYVSSTKLATGEITLNEEELAGIRFIYDCPEFEQLFGTRYSDDLVTPALQLEAPPYDLEPSVISEYWEAGRAEDLFWNGKPNGLNKIGYQKTVFPIALSELEEPRVRIVLNGFIPGYKQLFEAPDARTVAIHVKTSAPWREIRENVVGGESDPRACMEGSIRRDAYDGRIPLDAADAVVNGQRNVCHSSATLFDGLRELMAWFEYRPTETILGSVLNLVGRSEHDVERTLRRYLEDISWTTRDDTFAELFYEVRQGQVFDNLKGAQPQRQGALRLFAAETGADADLVHGSEPLRAFIENGVRWTVGGAEYYLFTVAKTLFQGNTHRSAFYEVAGEIQRLHDHRWRGQRPEVLAEAIRIAANDLRLLASPTYKRRLHNRELFSAQVIAELPEQALSCAERVRQNLVKDVVALVAVTLKAGASTSIADTADWQAFADALDRDPPRPEIAAGSVPAGLILAGGRSTRMSSTVPKPVLPFGAGLLFDAVAAKIHQAMGAATPAYALVGFRADLVRRALGEALANGQPLRYLTYSQTLGLAFRVATALETLSRAGGDDQLVALTYTDMPGLSTASIRRLVDRVSQRDAFGMLVCVGANLSGHVEERNGHITRVIQERLRPDLCVPGMKRDVGFYVFRNSARMRDAVLSIRNDNLRGEFIFADVVEVLAAGGQEIVSEKEDLDRSQSVNTAQELLQLAAAPFIRRGDGAGLRRHMLETLGLALTPQLHLDIFQASAAAHCGPLYFFPWWERTWLSKQ
jgi:CTP:molybdopterin cytidylyltransferase MocA